MIRKRSIVKDRLQRSRIVFLLGLCVFVSAGLGGCATLERLPAVTYAEARQIDIFDIPDARFYVSDTNRIYDVAIKAYQRSSRARPAHTRNFLALSGGGDDGAFGAGLLVGWSAHGNRPEFTFRFRWQKGSIAFWDNRSAKHIALGDTGPFRRLMRRVQIGGGGVPV